MPRAGRRTTAALAVALVFLVGFLAAIGAPAGAQGNATAPGDGAAPGGAGNATGDAAANGTGDAAGGVPRTVTIRAQESGCSDGRTFCWDMEAIPIGVDEPVRVVVDLSKAAAPHNFHVLAPIEQKTATESGVVQELSFTVPANQRAGIEFVCDVHNKEMFGALLPPAAFAELSAGGGHEEVPEMGVHFLAYWVGLIAFAILFVVYGITFFLFKYNESNATTDHWDRSGAEPKRVGGGVASLLAVVIAVAAIGVIIYLARFR